MMPSFAVKRRPPQSALARSTDIGSGRLGQRINSTRPPGWPGGGGLGGAKGLWRPRPPNSSTCRLSIGCANVWSASAPASSIKSAPSSWSGALLCGRAYGSYALSCRAYWPHPPDVLSPRMVGVIEGLAEDWRRLDDI